MAIPPVDTIYGRPTGTFLSKPYWAKHARDDGIDCESCGRLMKYYNRKLSSSHALTLINLYRLHAAEADLNYHHVSEFDKTRSRGDFAKMLFFGLLNEKPMMQAAAAEPKKRRKKQDVPVQPFDDEDKRTSGYWRITLEGVHFVEQQLKLPKYAVVHYESTLDGFAGKFVSIVDCLGSNFSYSELMGGKSDTG